MVLSYKKSFSHTFCLSKKQSIENMNNQIEILQGNCERLQIEFRQLTNSPRRRKRSSSLMKKKSHRDPLTAHEMAARSLKAQQEAARKLMAEKGGLFIDDTKPEEAENLGPDTSISDFSEMFLWSNKADLSSASNDTVELPQSSDSSSEEKAPRRSSKKKESRSRSHPRRSKSKKKRDRKKGDDEIYNRGNKQAQDCNQTANENVTVRSTLTDQVNLHNSIESIAETVAVSNTRGHQMQKYRLGSVTSLAETVTVSNLRSTRTN